MKIVKFINSKGQQFIGDFYDNESSKIIIVCYGRKSMRTNPILKRAINIYLDAGFDLYHFDPAGDSEEEELDIIQRVSDTNRVIDFFSKRYKEIIVGGGSLGAIVSSIVAIKNKRVAQMYTVNGLFDPDKVNVILKLRLIYLLKRFPGLNKQLEYVRQHLKPELIKVPTLVVFSKLDFIVGVKQSLDFYNRLRCKKKLLRIKMGTHKLVDRYDLLVEPTKKAIEWLNGN